MLGAAGAAGATAISERRTAARLAPVVATATQVLDARSSPAPTTPPSAAPDSVADTVSVPVVVPDSSWLVAPDSASLATPDSTPRAAVDSTPSAPLSLVVAQGRTVLADSIYVTRNGDTARVHFDVDLVRTRRADKFERIVRETLREVYGPAADTVLTGIPDGRLVRAKDLLGDFRAKGLRVPLERGWSLAIWPETRPGKDGPLVVRYRTLVIR